ncbi:MAG: hydroxymethylpyrimidine/phosphomethylpyrimidine kinase [Gammaproteobacteria bacterium]|nr:hydroxymethylpyrimidine/phosphomethylpyrimidine kinase [Gammaproteobacteria bacterium]
MNNRPTILTIAGHDPTGGAGIQADIETINSLGGHACSIITSLTSQDSSNLYSFEPVSADLIRRQFRLLHNDFEIRAIKTGMIGSYHLLQTLAELLSQLPDIPLIIDPVLAAGGGSSVSDSDFVAAFKKHLLPLATLVTPNTPEARTLSGKQSPDDCARTLLASGCKNILITGTHEDEDYVVNRLYQADGKTLFTESQRLPGIYHGSGCTLASAISFYLASNHSLTNSIKLAQEYTIQALSNADSPGQGQAFPVRR